MKNKGIKLQTQGDIREVSRLSEIGLADSLFEMYTHDELIIKRELLLGMQEESPSLSKLHTARAIYTAILWKEMEEERGYEPH